LTGLRGVKFIVPDAYDGIKATLAKVLNATWQRCHVHFMRNALAYAGKSGRHVVYVFIVSELALDEVETYVLAKYDFPPEHRTKLHSTNPIERLNGEIKRRTDVVGVFPTRTPSSASSERSCSSKMMSGRSTAPATLRWKPSRR
jgi:putative transposase